ncbi:MAG: hypothetical protein NUV72_04855, partial [Bauldia sp.]|nr:hypothetical protein [Bauldia sp.]
KTLHYHARRFYAPVAIAARIDGDTLRISGLNDTHGGVDVEAQVRRIDLDGRTLDETTIAGRIPADRSVEVGAVPIPAGDGHVFVIDARRKGVADFDPQMRLTVFPDKPKRYDLPDARVTLSPDGKPGVFTLAADKPAFFVKPEASEFAGAFDDASFLLLPRESRTIAFRSFDGRMPGVADIAINHVAATNR